MQYSAWDYNEYPLAYFITFRTYGTWLHGDERGSVDRHGRNRFAQSLISLDPVFSVEMDRNMSSEPFLLDHTCRDVVDTAIRTVCLIRKYNLFALSVRTNHAHVVVSASAAPKAVMNALKANATRELREAKLVDSDRKIWSSGGSARYLWKQSQLDGAVEYTVKGQGGSISDTW